MSSCLAFMASPGCFSGAVCLNKNRKKKLCFPEANYKEQQYGILFINPAKFFYIVLKEKSSHEKPFLWSFHHCNEVPFHWSHLSWMRGDYHALIRVANRHHRPWYAPAQPHRWRGSKAWKLWGSGSLGKLARGLMISCRACWCLEHWISSDLLQLGNSELFCVSIRSQQSSGTCEAGESCCLCSPLRQSAAPLVPATTGADVPAWETCKCMS